MISLRPASVKPDRPRPEADDASVQLTQDNGASEAEIFVGQPKPPLDVTQVSCPDDGARPSTALVLENVHGN